MHIKLIYKHQAWDRPVSYLAEFKGKYLLQGLQLATNYSAQKAYLK